MIDYGAVNFDLKMDSKIGCVAKCHFAGTYKQKKILITKTCKQRKQRGKSKMLYLNCYGINILLFTF